MEHDEKPRVTFAAFLEETDPALAEWARRATSTDDLRMATAYGQLLAFWELGEIADRYHEYPPFMTLLEQWAAVYLALARRRDACRFRRLLERHRAETDERREGGYDGA